MHRELEPKSDSWNHSVTNAKTNTNTNAGANANTYLWPSTTELLASYRWLRG
jgi:hypothetical protein